MLRLPHEIYSWTTTDRLTTARVKDAPPPGIEATATASMYLLPRPIMRSTISDCLCIEQLATAHAFVVGTWDHGELTEHSEFGCL